MNEVDFTRKWKEQGEIQGAEHEVYAEEGFVYKRNNLAYHTTWLQFFDRVALHNWLFPNTRLELIGFMDVLGDLRPVSKQRIVEGICGATREEVTREMQKLGFNWVKNDDYIDQIGGIIVEDLHDENVLVDEDGDLTVFDPVLYRIGPQIQ